MTKLIAQGETPAPDEGGRYFGFEMFHDESEGYYTARFHCRTYDGIKVASSYATDEVRLDGHTRQQAHAEMREKFTMFRDLYTRGT